MRKRGISYYLSHTLIHTIFIAFCTLIILPFILIISISITQEKDIYTYGYLLMPKNISFTAYNLILKTPKILLNAYGISIFITAVGTFFGLLFSAMLGYCISRKDFRYRKIITVYVIFTMLFNGGLVSFFIVMTKYLNLNNNLLAVILPGMVGAYYVILMRGFMADIPPAVIESAKIDGAREWTIFFKIILALSKPALATIGLFIAFGYWNEWFNSMLFINNDKLIPVQLLLVRLLNNIQIITSDPSIMANMAALGIDISDLPTLSTRMATCILAVVPMLIVFPFFQKYFVKGMTMGAVKG